MKQTETPSLSPEFLAALVSLLLFGGKLAYEMALTFNLLEIDFKALTSSTQLGLVERGLLHPMALAQLVVSFGISYLLMYVLTEWLMALSSPGADLMGGSIAQAELKKD